MPSFQLVSVQSLTRRAAVLLVLLLMGFSGCRSQPKTVVFNAVPYQLESQQADTAIYREPGGKMLQVVVRASGTQVTVDGQVYQVTGTEQEMQVTFPDGRILTGRYFDSSMTGMTPLGVDASMEDWNRVSDLHDLVFGPAKKAGSENGWRYLLVFLLAAMGLGSILNPRLAWFLREGWHYENLEPSEIYLGIIRIGGVVMVLAALYFLFLP